MYVVIPFRRQFRETSAREGRAAAIHELEMWRGERRVQARAEKAKKAAAARSRPAEAAPGKAQSQDVQQAAPYIDEGATQRTPGAQPVAQRNQLLALGERSHGHSPFLDSDRHCWVV